MISIFKHPACSRFPSIEIINRDVTPIPVHSHNDYWRKRPLIDALSLGCISVEADIWKFPEAYSVADTFTESTAKFEANELYVGHNQMHLKAHDTLEKMYLEPLQALLQSSNKQFPGHKNYGRKSQAMEGADYVHGVFYDDPEQTLDLWVDIKTDANATYRLLKAQLQSFIDKGYLSYFNEEEGMVHGPITVTLTGNMPWALIEEEDARFRYFFLDCPLYDFESVSEETLARYKKLCKYASTSYDREQTNKRLPDYFISKKKVEKAHENGIKTRIWGGPEWPRCIRNNYWDSVLRSEFDLLNTDHISDAANQY